MMLLLIATLFAATNAVTCSDCYTAFASVEYSAVNPLGNKAALCSAGVTLGTCLSANGCDQYYLNSWGIICNSLQCSTSCPPSNLCYLCQTALDSVVSSAGALADLPNFGSSALQQQFNTLMCQAVDSLKSCADGAAQADNKPCNIEARNCGLLKTVCPSTSCSPAGISLADLYISAQTYASLYRAEIKAAVTQISDAVQESIKTTGNELVALWKITLTSAAERAAAMAAFRTKLAATLGIDVSLITVNVVVNGGTGGTTAAPAAGTTVASAATTAAGLSTNRKRQATETWEVRTAEPASSSASLLTVSALLLAAMLAFLL